MANNIEGFSFVFKLVKDGKDFQIDRVCVAGTNKEEAEKEASDIMLKRARKWPDEIVCTHCEKIGAGTVENITSSEESANKDDVKSFIKDMIRKCIAVNVYNAIYVNKEKCDSQVEFSNIVKKATEQVVNVKFDDEVMKMTLEDFERESVASGDVTVSQLDAVKNWNFKFVLRCNNNDPNSTTIEITKVRPTKGD